MSGTPRVFYSTPKEVSARTGDLVRIAKDDTNGLFGISVYNTKRGHDAFVIIDRDELMRLRDAITKELAS